MISDELKNSFFRLLRAALCGEPCDTAAGCDWQQIYLMAQRQSMIGVVYSVIEKLPKDQQPPLPITMQWMAHTEAIRGMNQLQNKEAARLTKLFGDMGRRTAILKGQANARLYPDKFSRQPGDIDIWVEGGRDSVIELLQTLDMIDDLGKIGEGKAMASYHHVHLPPNENGVVVEVHFRPSSGTLNPITNRRLQRWLNQEMQHTYMTAEGFCVPSMRFALVMQLAHIQRHYFTEGIGLRQVCDYYMLLQNATESDRQHVADKLRRLGLLHTARAIMWLLEDIMHLSSAKMICSPDKRRGEWMLREIMSDGNFGKYAERQQHKTLKRAYEVRLRRLRLMRFDFWEVLWLELNYWTNIIHTLPTRIKYKRLSLKGMD